jgi:hypothetical protein
MAVLVFGLFSLAFLLLGPDGAFQAGSYEVSTTWLGVWAVVTVVAAFVGGWACRAVARSQRAGAWLAGLVVALGVASAAMEGAKPEPGPRPAAVDNTAAMMNAKQPAWVAWVTPVLGAAGVLLGARRKGEG